jgi:hypothetical protein
LRALPQRTEIVEADLAPEVFGWDKVDVLITLNYYQEMPLSVILGQIEKLCDVFIVVDHKNLHRANLSFSQLRGKSRANNITLNEALEQLCASIDGVSFTYRIVGGNVIELTPTHIAKQPDKMSIEIHRYKITDNTESNETPEQIIESITNVIEPITWNNFAKQKNTTNQNNNNRSNPETEKLPSDKGDIVIDRTSSCLIIRQSQPTQRKIRTWFKQQQNQTEN